MTIKDDYFRYLDHFGATITLRDLHRQPQLKNAVALRHDIDHDLDLALEVAHHEHARGIRATYFLLHTHPYWNDPQFNIKCRQLQAYGHEVGLHLNVLVEWMNRECDDIDAALFKVLEHLRQGGVEVDGVSAHGDRSCYQHQVINYWLFSDLRGSDPASSELHRSAEGVAVDDPRWQVTYPADHAVHRGDGRALPLWSVPMAKFGLAYDAMHIFVNRYWTDSGGSWSRSGDPLQANLREGRHQVLMHPYWWRGPQKLIFVLSTARAGSTWLANFVDRATSCKGLHEWTFNHYRSGEDVIADKRTGDDYLGVINNAAESALLIRHALATFKVEKRDVLEANVYLEPLLERLHKAAPDAVFIHLHRDAKNVVRSILNRGWYAAPIDYRHRDECSPLWPVLNQFERACWYWRFTNERLWPLGRRLSFEAMVSDLAYLTSTLNELGIVVHPLLAAEEFSKRINAGKSDGFSEYDDWSDRMRTAFQAICGPMQQLLGYESDEPLAEWYRPPRESKRPFDGAVIHHIDILKDSTRPFGSCNVQSNEADEGLWVETTSAAKSGSHVVFARGAWHELPRSYGTPAKQSTYYTGNARAELMGDVVPRIFLLCFDRSGRQIHKEQLATLRPSVHALSGLAKAAKTSQGMDLGLEYAEPLAAVARFAFVSPSHASHWALAIVVDGYSSGQTHGFIVRSISLEGRRLDPGYSIVNQNQPVKH